MATAYGLSAEQVHLLADLAGERLIPGLLAPPVDVSTDAGAALVRGVAARSLGARGLVTLDGNTLVPDPDVVRALHALAHPETIVRATLATVFGDTTAVWCEADGVQAGIARDEDGYLLEVDVPFRRAALERFFSEPVPAGGAPDQTAGALEVLVGRVDDESAQAEVRGWLRRGDGAVVEVVEREDGEDPQQVEVSTESALRELEAMLP